MLSSERIFKFEVMDPINKIERRRKEAETLVFWDINNCPVPKDCDAGLVDTCTVPKDYDARMVALGIESALKKAGVYGGPLTITAIGNLKYTSQLNPDVLSAIFSTGILSLSLPRG
ncbi:hypothetical protein Bca52824_087378 [Brassica carinata]|uniref:NYN domain-containing protein n=1 Tax=Brassica carinata TaxID=52824 RepID=A0A8X7PAK8_BRACI|nr:hypothetical protein Bca52824_087378 [Brassica carinata]